MRSTLCLLLVAAICAACGPSAQPSAKGGDTPPSSPTATPSPTPVISPLDLGDSTPAIFFRDAADFAQVDGLTWDGVVGAAPGVPDYHAANPAETLFGFPTEIRNRSGAVTNKVNVYGLKSFSATWADDGVHFCLIEPFDTLGANGIPAILREGSAEGGVSTIMQVGKIYEQDSTYVASCSFAADRAIVVQSGGQGIGVAQYWLVQVSAAKVLWTHDFATGHMPMSLVTSPDSHRIAENFQAPDGSETSTVYAGDGTKVTQFNSSVAGFSWDGSAVVLSSRRAPQPAIVVDLASGKTVWAAPTAAGEYVWNVKAQPGGDGLAIALADTAAPPTSSSGGYPRVDLYLVRGNGTLVTLLRGIYW